MLVGTAEGTRVGYWVLGLELGSIEGMTVEGELVGRTEGSLVGTVDGISVGAQVG